MLNITRGADPTKVRVLKESPCLDHMQQEEEEGSPKAPLLLRQEEREREKGKGKGRLLEWSTV